MPAKSNAFAGDMLNLILNGGTITGLADNAAVSPISTLYVGLHTADLGASGDQTTSEVSYTGYSRVGVARDGTGWTIAANVGTLAADKLFAQAPGTVTTQTAADFSIGIAQTGTGEVLYRGTISPAITIVAGVQPKLNAGSTITES